MDHVYTPIKKDDAENNDKIYWKYITKQVLICIAPWSLFFVTGLYFGTFTVMIPQLRKEANSTAAVSDEMASWLSSVHGYSSLPWVVILPVLSEIYGRKLPYNISSIVAFSGYVLWYFSTHVTAMLVAQIILGVLLGCIGTHSIVVISEYCSPRYRGVFLTIKSATFFWGILVANLIGTFYNWRRIVVLALICLMYNITAFFWPHSPHWLATQGRFEECAAAHRLLKGTSQEAENELKQLITFQKNYLRNNSSQPRLSCKRITSSIKVFSYKAVYKPVLLSIVLLEMHVLSGKLACNMYAIQILKKMTDQESTAYKSMLILDSVSLLGMYFGCFLAKVLKRRTMLFATTSCSVVFLFLLSLYLYIIKLNYITDYATVSIALLMIFSISINCGPMLLSTTIFAELVPLRYKTPVLIFIIIITNIIGATVLKVSPIMFKTVGLHGAFLIYGVSVLICLLILYKYLPETKDKTLIEIEENFEK